MHYNRPSVFCTAVQLFRLLLGWLSRTFFANSTHCRQLQDSNIATHQLQFVQAYSMLPMLPAGQQHDEQQHCQSSASTSSSSTTTAAESVTTCNSQAEHDGGARPSLHDTRLHTPLLRQPSIREDVQVVATLQRTSKQLKAAVGQVLQGQVLAELSTVHLQQLQGFEAWLAKHPGLLKGLAKPSILGY
jgi:hypothetical protein